MEDAEEREGRVGGRIEEGREGEGGEVKATRNWSRDWEVEVEVEVEVEDIFLFFLSGLARGDHKKISGFNAKEKSSKKQKFQEQCCGLRWARLLVRLEVV